MIRAAILSLVLSIAGVGSVFAGDCGNLCDREWWETATEDDVATEIATANVNAQDSSGNIPLLYAAGFGTSISVTALLDAGANLNARGEGGFTPLHVAATRFGTLASLKALLDAGAEVNAQDEDGLTPLHTATEYGTPASIKALLDAGANGQIEDDLSNTPFILAERNERVKSSDAYWRLNDAQYERDPEPKPAIAPSPEVDTLSRPSIPDSEKSAPHAETEVAADRTPEPDDHPVEEEIVSLNEPDIPAPKIAPPPLRRPTNIAAAKKAERLARQRKAQAEAGATKTVEAPSSTGTSRSTDRLSFCDFDALRVRVRGQFSPPQGLRNADQLAVTIRVELSQDGKIVGRPEVRRPSGRLDAQHNALKSAGVRALQKSATKGIFSCLPKNRPNINITFTLKEIRIF